MHYIIEILENNAPYKTLLKRKKKTAIQMYEKLLNNANNIIFEKKFKRTMDEISFVKYRILLKTSKGELIRENHFKIKEKVKLFNTDVRLTFEGIINLLTSNPNYYMIMFYHQNKIICNPLSKPIILVCKTKIDAERLYLRIRKHCIINKIKHILFTNILSGRIKNEFFKKLRIYYDNIDEISKDRSSYY